ncbi:hypothetical protein [Gleimia hominis]|uniref:hypothetical protein n=1 Tax=Gleimia hominis TaxID=595468 RepID=UPI000C802095|nr:hypothetical protein [Gleimia hominis]WIK63935.1 hypothetical protein CJ187_006390 [Gleimia hominis]
MSGLIRDNLYEEIVTEISWMKNALVDIADKLQVSTYAVSLLRNRVEPEEAASLERVIFLNAKTIAEMPLAEVRSKIVKDFQSTTGKEWFLSDELLSELLEMKLRELGIRNLSEG